MITNKEIKKVIDHLSQASYNANRQLGETPERLALIFSKKEVTLMEKNFQKRLTITQK